MQTSTSIPIYMSREMYGSIIRSCAISRYGEYSEIASITS